MKHSKFFALTIYVIISFTVYAETTDLRSGGNIIIRTIDKSEPLSVLNTKDFLQRHELFFSISDYYRNFDIKGILKIEIYAITDGEKILIHKKIVTLNKSYYSTSENYWFDPIELASNHPSYPQSRYLSFLATARIIPETGESDSYDELEFTIDKAFKRRIDIDFSTDSSNKEAVIIYNTKAYSSEYIDDGSSYIINRGEMVTIEKDSSFIYDDNKQIFPVHKIIMQSGKVAYINASAVEYIIAEDDDIRIGITEYAYKTSTIIENDPIQVSSLIVTDKRSDNFIPIGLHFINQQVWGKIDIKSFILNGSVIELGFERSTGLLYVTMEPKREVIEKNFKYTSFKELISEIQNNLYN